jgi:hypothetical protein
MKATSFRVHPEKEVAVAITLTAAATSFFTDWNHCDEQPPL